MIDESEKPFSPSLNAGTFPSGLSLRNSSSGAPGNMGASSYGIFFSASATRTLRTNGDTFTPNTVGMGGILLGVRQALRVYPSQGCPCGGAQFVGRWRAREHTTLTRVGGRR